MERVSLATGPMATCIEHGRENAGSAGLELVTRFAAVLFSAHPPPPPSL